MANENQESLYGMNVPRGTYAITGRQYGPSLPAINGKKATDGPPMIIYGSPPGSFNDAESAFLYGASLDSYLTLMNSTKLAETIGGVSINSIYRDGSTNAEDNNLWSIVQTDAGTSQQIQFMSRGLAFSQESNSTENLDFTVAGQGLGIRIPSMAGGWGRTVDGRPTDPSPTDDSNKRRNDDIHKLARETWKYGPIEFRWDPRRGCWSAYNELISDNQDTGLGTWVFGTNDDTSQGYPFVRGKLEDVWVVRKTFELGDTDGTQEGVQTAEVMTRLSHKFFDEDEFGSASLDTLFIIPHLEETNSNTHEKGDEFELGNELTGNSAAIDIRSTAHFFKEKDTDGQIKFGDKSSTLEICCKPGGGKFFIGEMVFMDTVPDFCPAGTNGGGNSVITLEGGAPGPDYMWVPAVKIDECQLAGKHFKDLVTNDAKLAIRVGQLCTSVTEYTGKLKGAVDGNFVALGAAIACLNAEVKEAVAILEAISVGNAVEVATSITALEAAMQAGFDEFAASVQAALIACGCEVTISSPSVSDGHGHDALIPGGRPTIDDCTVTISRLPELSCPTVCFGTKVKGTECLDQNEVNVGGCNDTNLPEFTTRFGECQQHESP